MGSRARFSSEFISTGGARRAIGRFAHRTLSPAEEMERRRLVIRDAHHENLIEGLSADADAEPIFDAYIRGEIELGDIFLRIKELYRLR